MMSRDEVVSHKVAEASVVGYNLSTRSLIRVASF